MHVSSCMLECLLCCMVMSLCAIAVTASDVLLYVCSDKLDSEAIVEFVRALCAIAQEELDPAHAPRVYGLTKIVEIAHFNMSRIRRALSCICIPESHVDVHLTTGLACRPVHTMNCTCHAGVASCFITH